MGFFVRHSEKHCSCVGVCHRDLLLSLKEIEAVDPLVPKCPRTVRSTDNKIVWHWIASGASCEKVDYHLASRLILGTAQWAACSGMAQMHTFKFCERVTTLFMNHDTYLDQFRF